MQIMISFASAVFVNHTQNLIQYLIPFRNEFKI
ncbi:hypothetical protein EAG_15537, partial [Camponotus floridanus]